MVQWLRLCTSSAGGPGSIPGQANISYMLQRRVHILQLKLLHATTNNWHTNICVCVYLCVFICVYIYVCIYIYVYLNMFICVHIYICIYIVYLNMYVYMCIYMKFSL